MWKLIVSFRGQKVEMQLPPGVSVEDVKAVVVSATDPSLCLNPSDIKLIHKGEILNDDQQDMLTLLVGGKDHDKTFSIMATAMSSSQARVSNLKVLDGIEKASRIQDDLTAQWMESPRRQRDEEKMKVADVFRGTVTSEVLRKPLEGADIALAKRNYEAFHSLPKGSATTGMLIWTSAGIAGWASCKIDEQQKWREDPQDETEVLIMTAKQNYENFHSLSPGSATLEMLENSFVGIAGWATYGNDKSPLGADSKQDDTCKKRRLSAKECTSRPFTTLLRHEKGNEEEAITPPPSNSSLPELQAREAMLQQLFKRDQALISQIQTLEQEDQHSPTALQSHSSASSRYVSPPLGLIFGPGSCNDDSSPPPSIVAARPLRRIARQSSPLADLAPASTPTGAPSQDLAQYYLRITDFAALKAEEQNLHQMLRSYEMDFCKEHRRHVSSFADIKPVASHYRRHEEIKKEINRRALTGSKAEEQNLHQMLRSDEEHRRHVSTFADIKPVASHYRRHKEITKEINRRGLTVSQQSKSDETLDSLEVVHYDNAKHSLPDHVDNPKSSSRRKGDDQEALQLRLALLESVGVKVDYDAKLLSLSHDGIDDDVDMFCDCDSEAQYKGEQSDEDDSGPEKREQVDATKVVKPVLEGLPMCISDNEVDKDSESSSSLLAENSIDISENEIDKTSKTGLLPRIESICLDSSEDDIDSQGSTESFVVVSTLDEWDSSSSEWSVI